MIKAAVIYDGHKSLKDSYKKQLECLRIEGKRAHLHLDFYKEIEIEEVMAHPSFKPNFVLNLTSNASLINLIEKMGYFVINGTDSIMIREDKALLYAILAAYDVLTPRFYVVPKVTEKTYVEVKEKILDKLKERGLRYPFRVLPRYISSLKDGSLIEDEISFTHFLKRIGKEEFIVLEELDGPMYMAYILGRKIVALSSVKKVMTDKGEELALVKLDKHVNLATKNMLVKSVKATKLPYAQVLFQKRGKAPLVRSVDPIFETIQIEHVTHKAVTRMICSYLMRNYKPKFYFEFKEDRRHHQALRTAYSKLNKRY